jgi:proteasome accessory factor B
VFRLSRVVGDVTASGRPGAARRPDGVDLAAIVASYDSSVATVTARVRLRAGRGLGLRRAATSVAPDGTGWDVVELQARDVDRLADQVLPYGADAVVVAPPEAVETVVRRLRALVDGAA